MSQILTVLSLSDCGFSEGERQEAKNGPGARDEVQACGTDEADAFDVRSVAFESGCDRVGNDKGRVVVQEPASSRQWC